MIGDAPCSASTSAPRPGTCRWAPRPPPLAGRGPSAPPRPRDRRRTEPPAGAEVAGRTSSGRPRPPDDLVAGHLVEPALSEERVGGATDRAARVALPSHGGLQVELGGGRSSRRSPNGRTGPPCDLERSIDHGNTCKRTGLVAELLPYRHYDDPAEGAAQQHRRGAAAGRGRRRVHRHRRGPSRRAAGAGASPPVGRKCGTTANLADTRSPDARCRSGEDSRRDRRCLRRIGARPPRYLGPRRRGESG